MNTTSPIVPAPLAHSRKKGIAAATLTVLLLMSSSAALAQGCNTTQLAPAFLQLAVSQASPSRLARPRRHLPARSAASTLCF